MPNNVSLPIEPVPAASQSTPEYPVVYAAAGRAFTPTTIETTQPVMPWQDKLTAPLGRPSSLAVTMIGQASAQARPKKSWLSAAAKRIREKIPAEAWDRIPDRHADDLDRNLYGS